MEKISYENNESLQTVLDKIINVCDHEEMVSRVDLQSMVSIMAKIISQRLSEISSS